MSADNLLMLTWDRKRKFSSTQAGDPGRDLPLLQNRSFTAMATGKYHVLITAALFCGVQSLIGALKQAGHVVQRAGFG